MKFCLIHFEGQLPAVGRHDGHIFSYFQMFIPISFLNSFNVEFMISLSFIACNVFNNSCSICVLWISAVYWRPIQITTTTTATASATMSDYHKQVSA